MNSPIRGKSDKAFKFWKKSVVKYLTIPRTKTITEAAYTLAFISQSAYNVDKSEGLSMQLQNFKELLGTAFYGAVLGNRNFLRPIITVFEIKMP